ncbi:hypothetical protein [Delftia lacustris]
MSKPINPIHSERYGNERLRFVDLRAIPEDLKVEILQAALDVAGLHDNGELYDLQVNSPEADVLEQLASRVSHISRFMHEVDITPKTEGVTA